MKIEINKDDLEFLYNELKKNIKEISIIMGVSTGTIRTYFKRYGIPARTSKESKILRYGASVINSKIELPLEDIIYLYEEQKLSLSMIAVMMNVSLPVVRCRLKESGVVIRGISESKKNMFKTGRTHINRIEIPSKKYLLELVNAGKFVVEIADMYNVAYSTAYKWFVYYDIPIPRSNTSSGEREVGNFLREIYKGKIIDNDRKMISPHELDIYLPNEKIAIEYDGVYTHSDRCRDKKYHLMKTELCEDKDIQLLHIFENEWGNAEKRRIWKSIISNKLGIYNKKIGARQTEIRRVSSKDSCCFFNENHLQGNCMSSIRYGLFHNGEPVSMMAFGKSRFNKNVKWELIRFCSKLHYQVYGGASKILSHFKKDYKGDIISYANRRWSTGNLYHMLGFRLTNISPPNYFYWNNPKKLQSRNKFQKHKLSLLLDNFDSNLTEYQNMTNNGYYRIWDCGNRVYRLQSKT